MDFQQVGGKRFHKYADAQEGEVLAEGTYVGVGKDLYDRPTYEIESDDGCLDILNSCGHLNYQMRFVKPGQIVKVIYEGKISFFNQKLGRETPSHKVKVLVAKDQPINEPHDVEENNDLDDFIGD